MGSRQRSERFHTLEERREKMNLAVFPRRRYMAGRTPIQRLDTLSRALGGPTIYCKRDDLAGLLAACGNKVRKLEFVVAEAIEQGAQALITCGAVQSNHCRLTLAAARKEGLECHLVLEERVPGSFNPEGSGNHFLYQLMGADSIRVVKGGSDMMAEMKKRAEELEAKGKKAYVIPGGASTPLGALGYVACAEEILSQAFEEGLRIDRVVCASGSAGTQAGLVVGFWGNRSNIPVVGINVSRKKDAQEGLVWNLARSTASLLGIKDDIPKEEIRCFDEYVGEGYSIPTSGMVEAVTLVARTEGILLDPVYTGKAMAGLIDLVRKGFFSKGENVLFVHTGGSPALFAYMDAFRKDPFFQSRALP
jgi:D-cysteine desulfhydrase